MESFGGEATAGRSLPRHLEWVRPAVRMVRRPYRQLRWATSGHGLARSRSDLDGAGVALTFDDGPDEVYTHRVLDVLAEGDVCATFFVVGKNARSCPDLVRRILDEGHSLASHSMTHPVPWERSPTALWRDYRAGHFEVSDIAGRDVRLFRPPKGHVDRRSAIAMRLAGLEPQLWTLDAADWEPDLRPEDVVERLGRPVDRSVILLHDAIEGPITPAARDRSAMVDGLSRFLASARRDGVRFVSLS